MKLVGHSHRRIRSHRSRSLWVLFIAPLLAAALLIPATSAAQVDGSAVTSATIYDDAIGDGFANWSWASIDFEATSPVQEGNASIAVDFAPWGGLALGRNSALAVDPAASLRFAVYGGANDSLRLRVVAFDGSYQPASRGFIVEAQADTWTDYAIPLADLGAPAAIAGFWWQAIDGVDPEPVHFDDIRLDVGSTPTPTATPSPSATPPPPPTATPTSTPTPAPTATPAPAPTATPTPTSTPTPAPTATPTPATGWAFEETFDGDPSTPSQELLPDNFEFVATHRSHPGEHFTKTYTPFLVDHADNCAGPNPDVSPLPQRYIETVQDSSGSNPDESFFVCKNHMMSSMGDVSGYSVSAFWPRQEFNFSDGGVLEFDVNINDGHDVRSWWEVMIVPRDELKVGAGPTDSPISETYPHERIVFDFRRNVRTIKVGTEALAPDGWLVNEKQGGLWDFAWWRDLYPDDPALDDRRVRRTMRIELADNQIHWGIETADGTFDTWSVDVPGGLPIDQGLVVFKTHAYTPTKDGNFDTYTFHWDNLRFDGPEVGFYDVHEASDVVYLQRNGDREIGETETVTIDLPADLGANPVLFGQVHQPKRGQVLVSVNGGPEIAVHPYDYENDNCTSEHWQSFRLELEPQWLQPGANELTWRIGPKPDCANGYFSWNGFSVKYLQVQTDAS